MFTQHLGTIISPTSIEQLRIAMYPWLPGCRINPNHLIKADGNHPDLDLKLPERFLLPPVKEGLPVVAEKT
ncbi:hypothetical protein CROQUDRAFT_651698 [Cronartium quercuum f. sp. fusiforme G11]|nr:hypothetical protein CROQUDRAFT_651698 [Cronartium quercuum f. sp. fusiforme G11]